MKKIPTIFKRNPENMREILQEHHPDCEWVFSGEGAATQKYDGTCCLVKNGMLYKRREIKKDKPKPELFDPVDHDPSTGKTVGWVPVTDSNEDKWHRDAFIGNIPDGTYELCGPKVQGNPEKLEIHILISHSDAHEFKDVPRTFEGIRDFMEDKDIEGLVFRHTDGRMGKIKKRDFQMKRV